MKRFLPISALLLSLWACRSAIPDVAEPVTLQGVDLALGVGANAYTKGNPAVIREMQSQFSGISETIILPFGVRNGSIGPEDRCLYHPCRPGGIQADGLVGNNRAHLFPSQVVSLPRGTSSVLAYGVTPSAPGTGALSVSNLLDMGNLRYPSYICFSPVPICGNEIPEAGVQIADILSGIVSAASTNLNFYYLENGVWKDGHVSVAWDGNSENLNLREWFTWITNDGRIMSACGFSVEYMLTRLYRLFKDYASTNFDRYEYVASTGTTQVVKTEGGEDYLTWADIYNSLRDEVLERIENNIHLSVSDQGGHYTVRFADEALSAYPGNLGLPDGAAVIRWNGTGFQPVADNIDGAASVGRFCYPPKLWYYANTTLRTSDEEMDSYYTPTRNTWNDILMEYRTGIAVAGDTKSVALEAPLQYSTGMLVCTVSASESSLDDGDGDPNTRFSATGTNFPVTGVIIGSQKELGYDFTPKSGGEQYFMYDNRISGVYLTSQESAPLQALVSQTPEGDNVYFCLELKNQCGKAFTGASGEIVPGGTFYLVGSLDMPPAESGFRSVFIQDCATTVSCSITSLAHALNAIPDLENPRLTLGIQTGINWIQSTSSYILLY